MNDERPDFGETHRLLGLIQEGDSDALGRLLARHRGLIRRMVEARMDPKLRGRVDASDVVQEAHIEVARRINDYLERRPMPFHLWLRQTAYQNLLRFRRRHVEAGCRAVENEVPLPDRSSIILAQQLIGNSASPAKKLLEREMAERVQGALAEMGEIDREILLMRHLEQMGNRQVAEALELDPKAANKRYARALVKLRARLVSRDSGESHG